MFKEMDTVITIIGLTHKWKNRVREHGNQWTVTASDGAFLRITPVNPSNPEFPYSATVKKDIDIEVVNDSAG